VAAAGSGGEEREETETTLKQKRNAMRSVSIQKANGLATYPWCRVPAKVLTSTMVTIQNEGFVNNSNMAVALETTTSSKQSRSATKCALKTTSS